MDNNAIAKALGITPETQKVLDAGSEHSYKCRCDTCKAWWVEMGPEDDGKYGPFTKQEINSFKRSRKKKNA